ncbi:biotin transport system substrate-specific component [Motilibacter rhizosphaerae]|uniref:Biotin transporter n=1 Tax=Motilibacter rhizosphaerae TaxID=598652 RepID=A0A4Q7NQE4_9ACTN|nr:biotin transporter BioY [Motilibacter rhizosphaerae]RZS87541.1 biotin transport system substrate-specific component [Motilibacter rhizosphaerae]
MTTNAVTLRRAVLPRSSAATEAALVAAGVLFLWAGAAVSVPLWFTPVPLTLQTFSVLLLASAFGARLGVLTFAAYFAVGLAGAPIFSQGHSGLAVLHLPSGGYLVGMLLASLLVGALADRGWDKEVGRTVVAMVLGNLVVYACGVPWLAAVAHFSLGTAVAKGAVPFFVGDGIKIALATAVLPTTWALLRRARG